MSATIYNLPDMHRGDDVTIVVTYTGDGDLTTALITATWRDSQDAVVFTRANLAAGGAASQITMTTPVSGIFTIYVVPANTTGLLIKTTGTETLNYDVQVTTGAGLVHTILRGTMRVLGDATR